MTDILEAVTSKMREIFAANLETATPGTPANDQYAEGVGAVVEVREVLRPTYDDPACVDLEVDYLPPDMGEGRSYYFVGLTVRELLAGMDVEVPKHELSWTVTNH